jgi:hypothetical protein
LGFSGKQRGEFIGVLAAAFEAWPVAGREGRHLIEKEQLGVAVAPDLALAVIEFEFAADPLQRRPAAASQLAITVMNAPAPIAQHRPREDAANNSPKGETRDCSGINRPHGEERSKSASRTMGRPIPRDACFAGSSG